MNMKNLVEKVNKYLGSPVIKVELTDEQIQSVIETNKPIVDKICSDVGSKFEEFVTIKLAVIECKIIWANILGKYEIDGVKIDLDNIYRGSMEDSYNFSKMLEWLGKS